MSAALHRYAREEAEARGLKKDDVLGRSRNRVTVEARHAVVRRLHDDGMCPYAIGHLLGLNNSTVRSALAKTGALEAKPRRRNDDQQLGAILGSRALLERQVRFGQYPCKLASETIVEALEG